MNFAFSDDHDTLRETARRFLAGRLDRRAQIELPGAHDPALWKELASLGWLAAVIPQTLGGQSSGLVATCILLEEAGRALLPGPFGPTVDAIMHLVACGSPAQQERHLPRIAAGEEIVARGPASMDGLVPCAVVADFLLLDSPTSPPVLVARALCELDPVDGPDLTRPLARARAKQVSETLARADFGSGRRAITIAAAAEAVGVAAGALEMAVAYAKTRQQFGKPIGSFQSIKHKAADMFRSVEHARLAVYAAAAHFDSAADLDRAHAEADDIGVATAAALAIVAALKCAEDNIQIHGGIGVTWEHDAHLYYRRALDGARTLGSLEHHREAVAAALLDREVS